MPATTCTVTGLADGTAYTFTVVATDGGTPANSAEQTVTVSVNDLNDKLKLLKATAAKEKEAAAKELGQGASDRPFDLVFHGGSGSTAEEIKEAVSYGVVKMNIDTDTQYAFTRPVADHMLKNYDGVLKVDGEVGNKKAYDPRAWGKLAEAGMAATQIGPYAVRLAKPVNSKDGPATTAKLKAALRVELARLFAAQAKLAKPAFIVCASWRCRSAGGPCCNSSNAT